MMTMNIVGKLVFTCQIARLVFIFFRLLIICSSPRGFVCDTATGRCNKGEMYIPFYAKTKALPMKKVEGVICPGSGSEW